MIDMIYTKHPYYGTRRVCKLLERLGFKVGRKFVKRAFEFMGIRALYPKVKTSISSKEHKKYPYLLCSLKNNKGQVIAEEANKVWSGDITYRWLKNCDSTIDYQFMININLLKLGSYGYKLQGKLGKK